MSQTVCVIRGDGVGPEVIGAAVEVLGAAGVELEWVDLPAGESSMGQHEHPLPERTVAAIMGHKVCLKGPVSTPPGRWGFVDVNAELRRRLGLYAAVRPIRSLSGVPSRYAGVDLVLVGENTEGPAGGLEHTVVPGVVQTLGVTTLSACTRIAKWAFDYAEAHGRKRVAVFQDGGGGASGGLLAQCAGKLHRAFYASMGHEALSVAAGCMHLVREPERFDVVLMDNRCRDMVGGLCAGLVGGLGVVPGANVGDDCAVFEPVHGTAMAAAGQGTANPVACILSGAMLLGHLGLTDAAVRVRSACQTVLGAGDAAVLTPDMGGEGRTDGFARAVIEAMK